MFLSELKHDRAVFLYNYWTKKGKCVVHYWIHAYGFNKN